MSVLWNWPDLCPQCKCTVVYPYQPTIEVVKPDELKWRCADVHCNHVFTTEKLMTGKAQFAQAFIVHLRIKKDLPDTSVTGPAIPPPRPYRCVTRLVFAKNTAGAIKVATEDLKEQTIEHTDVFPMEDLVNDNCRRSEHHRDP